LRDDLGTRFVKSGSRAHTKYSKKEGGSPAAESRKKCRVGGEEKTARAQSKMSKQGLKDASRRAQAAWAQGGEKNSREKELAVTEKGTQCSVQQKRNKNAIFKNPQRKRKKKNSRLQVKARRRTC